MIKAYFENTTEQGSTPEMVAVFAHEDLYEICRLRLELIAKTLGKTLTIQHQPLIGMNTIQAELDYVQDTYDSIEADSNIALMKENGEL